MQKYKCIKELPRYIPAESMDRRGHYYDNLSGQYLPIENKNWHNYRGIELPTIAGSNISCGVRQLYSIHRYPPSLIVLMGLLYLKEGNRFSSFVLSDTDRVMSSVLASGNSRHLYTKWELESLTKGINPGELVAQIIEEAKGTLGTVSGSQPTRNRNTSNPIRTYIWTIPYFGNGSGYSVESFDFSGAITYMNEYREKNGATE